MFGQQGRGSDNMVLWTQHLNTLVLQYDAEIILMTRLQGDALNGNGLAVYFNRRCQRRRLSKEEGGPQEQGERRTKMFRGVRIRSDFYWPRHLLPGHEETQGHEGHDGAQAISKSHAMKGMQARKAINAMKAMKARKAMKAMKAEHLLPVISKSDAMTARTAIKAMKK